jgi:hypothetical protein
MKTFLNACARALLALVLVHVVAPHAVAQAVQIGSAEHQQRLWEYRNMLLGIGAPKKSPVAKTADGKEAQIQAFRDSVIASGAVVRYIMTKEKMSKDEWEYVRVYVNANPTKAAPLLKGLDKEKMRQFIERDEVQAWIVAEEAYQAYLKSINRKF